MTKRRGPAPAATAAQTATDVAVGNTDGVRQSATQARVEVEPLLFERLLRLDAELKNAVMSKQVLQLTWEIGLHKHLDAQRSAEAQVREANEAFAQIVRTVESQYTLRMQDYAMCTETGCLTRLDNPTDGE